MKKSLFLASALTAAFGLAHANPQGDSTHESTGGSQSNPIVNTASETATDHAKKTEEHADKAAEHADEAAKDAKAAHAHADKATHKGKKHHGKKHHGKKHHHKHGHKHGHKHADHHAHADKADADKADANADHKDMNAAAAK